MESAPNEPVMDVLADVIREALSRGESVHVPGLGTFGVAHKNSQVAESPDGQLRMQPPRDEVSFRPDA